METASDRGWHPPPGDLALTRDEVHVWRASLNGSTRHVRSFQDILAPDELSRMRRFRFEKDRQRFVIAHGLLRTILSSYLNLKPDQLRFVYNQYGKTALVPLSIPEGTLNFNLSHAGSLLLVAITCDRGVGVDVEEIRLLPNLKQIAKRFFAAPEMEALQALPPDERHEAFFRLWTCKEAFVKARGDGLWLPLDRFHIAPVGGGSPPMLHIPGDPGEAARWTLRELKPAPGYQAALAVEGVGWKLTRWCCGRNWVYTQQPVS